MSETKEKKTDLERVEGLLETGDNLGARKALADIAEPGSPKTAGRLGEIRRSLRLDPQVFIIAVLAVIIGFSAVFLTYWSR